MQSKKKTPLKAAAKKFPGKKLISSGSSLKKPPTRRSSPGKPALEIQSTSLWDYPSQHYGEGMQGDQNYRGATPSYVVWNLIQRYSKEGQKVLDPMCGSGTTVDVCKDSKRLALAFDLVPSRPDIQQSDARHLPLKSNSVDLVFIDPPYADHLDYSDHKRCIGKLSVELGYYQAMSEVIDELYRVLKPGCYLGLYVSDSFKKGKGFEPIGFRLFEMMQQKMEAIDIIAVTRHNRTLLRRHWHSSAIEGNYFLRGFNYLFIMRKPI